MKESFKSLKRIIPVLTVVLVMIVMAICGDYYFDLNDDVLMKDILSGAYTGVPEGNNIQMLYPISAFISVLYRIVRPLDWYGIFLCLCQYLCVFIICNKVLSFCKSSKMRIVLSVMLPLFMLGVIGSHFVFVQYTFTCGLLSATATLLILTHEKKDKNLILAVALIAVAYLLRSEMLLLTLPMVGVAILIKWAITQKEFMTYVKLLVAIVLVVVVSQVANKIAYSSEEWKEFYRLFDARTELYDFQYIPEYADNSAFYESIGLSGSEWQLLVNYNFGIDDEINADTLNAVAAYADKLKTDEIPLPAQLRRAIKPYLYRLRYISYQKSYEYPMTDFPWNIVVFVLYIGTICAYLFPKNDRNKKQLLIMAGLLITLFACRSTLWLFIIVRGRDPIRITHPLYLMEIIILLGMILLKVRDKNRSAVVTAVIVALISLVSVPNQLSVISAEMQSRDKMRQHYATLDDYFEENSDKFYFVDVYTSVSCGEGMIEGETTFSEKMFDDVDNSFDNHDLMGGWASKCPLYYDKLEKAGFTSMQDALLQDNVFMVQNVAEDTQWIVDYYSEKGIDVGIEQVDTVADAFGIYSITVR